MAFSLLAFAGLLAALFWDVSDNRPDRAAGQRSITELQVDRRDTAPPQPALPRSGPAPPRVPEAGLKDSNDGAPEAPRRDVSPDAPVAPRYGQSAPAETDGNGVARPRPTDGKPGKPDRQTASTSLGRDPAAPDSSASRRQTTDDRDDEERASQEDDPEPAAPKPQPKPDGKVVSLLPSQDGRAKQGDPTSEVDRQPPARSPEPKRSWDDSIKETLARIEREQTILRLPVNKVPAEAQSARDDGARIAPNSSAYQGSGGSAEPLPVIHDQRDLTVLVQTRLKQLGYNPGEIDGKLGMKTRRAIVRFQVDRNLRPSGWIDQVLVGRLIAESNLRDGNVR